MNTLLHIADSAIMYRRGKQTGLAGLIGIILTLVIASNWDKVLPVLEFLHIVSLLDSMGLIVEGAPEMTFLRIVMAAYSLSISAMVFGTILIAIIFTFVIFTHSEVFTKLIIGIAFIAFFPFVLLYWTGLLIQFTIDRKEKRKDPEGYAERKRLEINKDVIEYFINAGVDEEKKRLEKERDKQFYRVIRGKEPDENMPDMDEKFQVKNNVLTFDEAYNRLNRLPTLGDYFFILGVTYERELCILIPKPVAPRCLAYGEEPNCFVGEKIKLTGSFVEGKFLLDKKKEYVREVEYPDTSFTNNRPFIPDLHEFTYFKYDKIEMFIDLSRAKQLHPKLKFYRDYKHYQHFVERQQSDYFSGKNHLKQALMDAPNETEFDHHLSEIKKYNASNEGAVQYIWEQEQQAKLAEG